MITQLVKTLDITVLQALSPKERYEAMRSLDTSSMLFTNKWFVLFCCCLVAILVLLLVFLRRAEREKRKENERRLFTENCAHYGLDDSEATLFRRIADRSGVPQYNMVFTLPDAFDKGSSSVMQYVFRRGVDIENRRELNRNIRRIREKLGFAFSAGKYASAGRSGRALSSRNIPVGKKVSVSGKTQGEKERIDAYVVHNDSMEFRLRPELSLEIEPGEMLNVHYRFGAAVWEFDMLVMYNDNGEIVLSHCEKPRFVNRRRFLRVSVNKPALVANFPTVSSIFSSLRQGLMPKFCPARVVELSGPGLKIQSDIDLRPGERILIIFELEKDKVVEDIAEIRGIRESAQGKTIAIELVGLTDSGVNQLVKATNNAALGFTDNESLKQQADQFVKEGEAVNV